jgi:hypothetical protein
MRQETPQLCNSYQPLIFPITGYDYPEPIDTVRGDFVIEPPHEAFGPPNVIHQRLDNYQRRVTDYHE